jgi:hypothetical protein
MRVRKQNEALPAELGDVGERYVLACDRMPKVLKAVRAAPILLAYSGLPSIGEGIHVMLSLRTVYDIFVATKKRSSNERIALMNAAMVGATFPQPHASLRALLPPGGDVESRWNKTALWVCVSIFVTADEHPACARAMFAANLPMDLTDLATIRAFAAPTGFIPNDAMLRVMQKIILSYIEAGGNPEELADYCAARLCTGCGNASNSGKSFKKCGRCRKSRYCSEACQHAHWPVHKQECVGKK